MKMTRKITPKAAVVLEPMGPPQDLMQPLFAINWFNTRLAWLYTLYNWLAAVPLYRTGARVIMKARLRQVLRGNAADSRDLLLVVNYPSGERFLDLLGNRLFQLVSVLRILAVKDFSFVLHKRPKGNDLPGPGRLKDGIERAYAVHHFRSSVLFQEELSTIAALTEGLAIRLCFGSEKAAAVASVNRRGRRHVMPYVIHKAVLFEAGSYPALEAFLTGERYRQFCAELDDSFIGTLDRIM